jgi:ADP-ribose pyrophosphatase
MQFLFINEEYNMNFSWVPEFKDSTVNILQEKIVFSGHCQVKNYQVQFPLFKGGLSQPVLRECVCRPPAVAVLLHDPEADQLVLVEQFRIGALAANQNPWLLEIVAGVIEPGESIEEAVLREVQEEAGCTILSCKPIYTYFTTPGIVNEQIHIFYARVKAPLQGAHHGNREEGEDIKVHVLSSKEALSLLERGQALSSPLLIALQWFALRQAEFFAV